MGILGETYIPLLTQDEVWRTVDGGEFALEEMPSEHRAAVLNLLERVAPVLYAEWVNDLLLGASDPGVRAEFGLGDPDPLTGHYARSEVLAWLEAQPLVRRLHKLRLAVFGKDDRVKERPCRRLGRFHTNCFVKYVGE